MLTLALLTNGMTGNHIIHKCKKNSSLLFYCAWIILSLCQATFTELLDDEAYYWKYSTQLDWGYFDHPPMIALMIKLGFSIFKSELGVRLVAVFLNIFSIYFIEKLTQPNDKKLFYTIISSVFLLQLIGFLAVPDNPLLFFSILFYFALKRYLESDNLLNSIFLALCVSMLLYSKYHGVLLVFFCLLPNFQLLKKQSFWIVATIATILYAPHIFWQIKMGLPSLKYHFFERSTEPYEIWNTITYLFTLPFVFGPFIGFFLIYSLFFFHPKNSFEKTVKVSAITTFVFFLMMTIKDSVEGNWTIIALFPLIFTGYRYAEIKPKLRKIIYIIFPFTLLIIFFVRLNLVWNFMPKSFNFKTEFYNNAIWAEKIEKIAKNNPVAFMNSYQKASKYEFYSGNPSFSLNNAMGRKNQYTIWDSEQKYQGKTVCLILNYCVEGLPVIQTPKGDFQYTYIENFRSFGNIQITPNKSQISIKRKKTTTVQVKFNYLNNNRRDLEANMNYPTYLSYVVFQGKKKIIEKTSTLKITNAMINTGKKYEVNLKFSLTPGVYNLVLCTKTGWLPSAINENHIRLNIFD